MPRGRPIGSGRKGEMHRYQLSLITAEFEAIRTVARELRYTLRATFERIIGLGLILYTASRAGNPIIIRRKGAKDREILIV